MISKNDLEEMSQMDIINIPCSDLKELTDIHIDPNAPLEDRINQLFEKIENPYCFLVNGVPFQISYSNQGKTIEKCLADYFVSKNDI